METITYGFSKEVHSPFEQAVQQVTEKLQAHGFGVVTKIDVRQVLKEKLDIDFKKYVILGACNPASAHQALLAEESLGLLLPCNVIVYERQGTTVVSAIKPTVTMQMVGNPNLKDLAKTIETKLQSVIASLK